MQSIKELYKIGRGPSSSHTMGPEKIAKFIKAQYPDPEYSFKVTLHGSLALTGVGHGTDKVIKEVLGQDTVIVFNKSFKGIPHPNTMDIAVLHNGQAVKTVQAQSIGGGNVLIEGTDFIPPKEVYDFKNFDDIKKYAKANNKTLSQIVYDYEPDIKEYLYKVWQTMKDCVERGLKAEGILPGGLNLERKAKYLFNKTRSFAENNTARFIFSYALAVAEENASNNTVVTAPTCGASGVLPSVLYYLHKNTGIPEEKIIDALAVAGLIGNVVKTNASISGAECGCQAEIGTACSMGAGAICSIFNLSINQIECASEVAMEHSLGLTCDPVKGLVQVPCIERNAMGAMRAVNAYYIAEYLAEKSKISFDEVVDTMYQTGKDLSSKYKETSKGGLAVIKK